VVSALFANSACTSALPPSGATLAHPASINAEARSAADLRREIGHSGRPEKGSARPLRLRKTKDFTLNLHERGCGRRGLESLRRTDFGQGDQEMGGLKPGAGSALAKVAGLNAGAANGVLPSMGTSGHTVTATLWQSWQLEQVVWLSHGAGDAATPCACAVPLAPSS
jgi:hypothetical protein